jgi:hypothetical protein
MAGDTAAPQRNFTLTLEERLRAFAQGLPAHLRRRRQIEDLEARLAARLAVTAADQGPPAPEIATDLAKLNDLIDKHNRYYPIEAKLPLDPRTGALIERGSRWRPLPAVTLEHLRTR